jgi:hypothetical protein
VHTYIGSGPYCYANSLAMVLGPGAPAPERIEVLTGSPFGFQLIAGHLPLFDPFGWDPERGLGDAIDLLGWACDRRGADDDGQAVALLREAVGTAPVLAGPMEFGLLRHWPGMTGPIGSDHFVAVLDVDDTADGTVVRFHDPNGAPYVTLPVAEFLASWRANTIAYRTTPYTMRSGFRRVREVGVEAALRASLKNAAAWLHGRDDLGMPPGTLGGAAGVERFADQVSAGLDPGVRDHLAHFAIRVGARRLADAATALADLGYDDAAAVATRQARLVGGLQYDIVGAGAKGATSAAEALRRLAPTYGELAAALS